jgi:hypothetical protein
MRLSREATLVSGVTLLAVPTIMYGGITLLGLLTHGLAGSAPSALALDAIQWALWRAGYAHAGVWVILSLVMQILLDSTRLLPPLRWWARLSAPVAAVTVSGGFLGVAFFPPFWWLLYFGGLSLLGALLLTGVGLLRNLRAPDTNTSAMLGTGLLNLSSRH